MAANKPTAVHFSLIIFVMISVIAMVAFYLNLRDYKALAVTAQADRDKLNKADQLARTQDDFIQLLKKYIGHNYDEIGSDDGGASTVIGSIRVDLDRIQGLSPEAYSYNGAVAKLLADLQKMNEDLNIEQGLKDRAIDRYNSLDENHRAAVKEHEDARTNAETDLANQINTKEEEISGKDKEIDDLRGANGDLQVTLEDERTARAKEVKDLRSEINDLTVMLDLVREKLDEATKESFERADGYVRWIDNLSNMVWINLGSADNLNKRTTFSVYTKANTGVGRGREDIKGSIEVTRIVDAHTAEARILWDDIYRPIAKGDPIYTPLWAPGRREHFAVVGRIDLDGDGDVDREEFHQIVAGVGASIDHEVTDEGMRLRYTRFPDVHEVWQEGMPGIDVHTKFLIIGEIPSVSETSIQEEKDKISNILIHLKDLRAEARRQGTRSVSLNDFLSYVGYKPQRRLWVPGVNERPFNLRSGAQSTATNETVGNRESSGQVSSLYSSGRKMKPKTSSGQTSKLFDGGY